MPRRLLSSQRAETLELEDEPAPAAEASMAAVLRTLKERSFVDAPDVDMTPELKERLNREFRAFLNEFVLEHKFETEIDAIADELYNMSDSIRQTLFAQAARDRTGNMAGADPFGEVERTPLSEPYSAAELYKRQLHHAAHTLGVGAQVEDVYRPHEDVHRPPQPEEASVAALLAAGAHLGHSTARLRPSTLPFVHGVRQGVHIIDLDQTLVHLRRAARVVEGIAEKGGIVLFIGTRKGQEKTVRVAAERAHGYYVHTKWVAGTLSNAVALKGRHERMEVDMGDAPTGVALGGHLRRAVVKPDVVVLLNPVENRNVLRECVIARVPTIGIIDTDSEPSLVTYPIPANDDSLRACDLIAGVLSNAARRGRERRLADFAAYQRQQAEPEDFNANARENARANARANGRDNARENARDNASAS